MLISITKITQIKGRLELKFHIAGTKMKVPTMLSYSPNEQQLGSGPTPSRAHYLKRLPKPHIGLFVWALTGPMAASLWSYNSVGDPIVSALVGLSNCTFILPIISYILSTVLQSDFDLKRPTCLRFMELFLFCSFSVSFHFTVPFYGHKMTCQTFVVFEFWKRVLQGHWELSNMCNNVFSDVFAQLFQM